MSQERYRIEADGTLIVTDGVTGINEKEFRDFDKITKAVLPRTVQWIGSSAFSGCKKLKSINIPVGVKYIESFTFSHCESLTEIVIPEGVVRIETNAFGSCKKLKKVSLPSTLQELCEESFEYCTSLKEIVIPDHTEIESKWCLGHFTPFMHCDALEKVIIREVEPHVSKTQTNKLILLKEYMHHPSGPIFGAIVSAEPGEDISKYARIVVRDLYYESFRHSAVFLDWEEDNFKPANLFSDSLNELNPHYAVVDLPGGISPKTIQVDRYRCLSDIEQHKNLSAHEDIIWTPYVENAVTADEPVESEPASESRNESDIYEEKPIIIACNKEELQNIITAGTYDTKEPYVVQLLDSCTEVGENAFRDDKTIGKVILPDSVRKIGKDAFEGCSSLMSIDIYNSVVEIGDNAFANCSNLSEISIPDSVVKIGSGCFWNCSSLESLTISKYVREIGAGPLGRCSSLSSIVVDPENPMYDSRDNCNALIETASGRLIAGCNNTVIPNSVSVICKSSFMESRTLSNLEIPDSVKVIEENAFWACNGLKSLVIPSSVEKIGAYAFVYCNSLRSITIPDSISEIGNCSFDNCKALEEINLPETITRIGLGAFGGCSSLKIISLPKGIVEIGSNAFIGCSSLTEIHIYNPLLLKGAGVGSNVKIIIE